MPRFDRIAEDSAPASRQDRISLDERFVALLLPQSPLDRVESQELRQIVLHALQKLTPQELKAVEGRHQKKRSLGAVASHSQNPPDAAGAPDPAARERLRTPLIEYRES